MPTPTRPSSSAKKPVLLGLVVVIAAGLLGFVSYRATAPEDQGSGTPATVTTSGPDSDLYRQLAELARRDADDKLARGRTDAPVVLIEYADFRCSYCGKFARDTEPELIEKYVEDGTLRIEWRNFPIFGKESEAAARASWAAGQQDRFWAFHRAAYAEDAKEKGFGPARLRVLAQQAGVKDLDRFARDTESAEANAAVGADRDQAYGIGATSTPSFLINGHPVAGAQPTAVFTQAIESAAAEAANVGSAGDPAK
ncbi:MULTISPECIES: DsbA family protein [unclassified Streptomyces]|uniref:DsbA family protein n=1 Tax=unclassified Streptomyces TaxID=2593676 RepID=UPI0009397FA8|nr:thioredoxin domain-containing protein [Streptomyces sp. CB02058]OKI91764.1 disulfide bond formation protein DsbA [Streptomyces sp. CB02058]